MTAIHYPTVLFDWGDTVMRAGVTFVLYVFGLRVAPPAYVRPGTAGFASVVFFLACHPE
ncbi:MAG TPA: hypothetical protein VI524_07895 [Anaerolineales bacterium]|nr:hypothetical protein [Anaerolineales bacterium]